MRDAVIVSAVRTAVGKAPKGTLRTTRPDEMGAVVIKEAIGRVPGLEMSEIEDVIMGCAMPEAEQGLNVARIASLRAGVPHTASAVTVNRFCSSGLQAIAYGAERIMLGAADLSVHHHFTIWDALILSAAADAGCRLLLSEDLQDGFTWSGVTVTNPFTAERHPLLDAWLEQADSRQATAGRTSRRRARQR